ncbi:hypothetical protein pb186bvf_003225 [Paramecium bursaria]
MIQNTIEFVKLTLKGVESGHDFSHAERVMKLAEKIAEKEQLKQKVDLQLVQLGALLHDIADHKFHNGDETVGPRVAQEFLLTQNASAELIQNVKDIINQISFKGANAKCGMSTLEGQIVQDADRLDALGAIGIARCFTYGGYKNRALYDSCTPPIKHNNFEEYKNSQSTTINHFHEKLLLLKDMMNTETGRELALHRHRVMEGFLQEFYSELEGLK